MSVLKKTIEHKQDIHIVDNFNYWIQEKLTC